MKILIIGGTGNISRWFVQRLAEQGADLTLYNRAQREVRFPGNVKQITGDRTDYARFEQQMREAGTFDCVIDMVGFEPADAESAVRAFAGRTGQFIFCSTVDVYPKRPTRFPVGENYPLSASPSFAYGHKKVWMEQTFRAAYERGNFPLTVLRPGATFSEGWSPLVTAFGGQSYHLDRLQKGKPIVLHGDGSALWTACHSDDVGRAFIGAIGNQTTLGKAYNVTGDEPQTWHLMHSRVADALGASAPDFVCIPTDVLAQLAPEESEWCVENFQYTTLYDNAAAKTDLGFTQAIPWQDAVRRCLDHLLTNNLIENSDDYPFYDRVVATWRERNADILSV